MSLVDLRKGNVLITLSDIDRFFKSVDKTPDCWIWVGFIDDEGYGRFSINGLQSSSHVVSYLLHFGKIPAGLNVCHSCDNRYCVNPDHLWLGTNEENMIDMIRKGRCGGSKLTFENVVEIRKCVAFGATQREMCKRFGVTKSTINAIIKKKTWKLDAADR